MADDRIPPAVQKLIEIAKEMGARPDDPGSLSDFLQSLAAEVAKQAEAKGTTLGGVEPWQMLELQQAIVLPILTRLIGVLGEPPRFALLFLLVSGEDPHAGYATDHEVGIRATFEDGTVVGEGLVARMAEMGGAGVPPLARVEPLVPCDGFFLSVVSPPLSTPQLLAWDFRSLVASPPASALEQLVRFAEDTGVPQATRRRTAQLRRLHHAERLDLLRDAVASNTVEPGVRRMPLHGLVQTGHPVHQIDAAEGTVQPYRLLKFVDRLLEQRLVVPYRQGRAVELDPRGLGSAPGYGGLKKGSDGVRRQPAVALDSNAPGYTPDEREHANDIDAARRLVEQYLKGKELAAMLLYLDAEYRGQTPEKYCETLGRSYQAVKRAHARAIVRLKEIVAQQR